MLLYHGSQQNNIQKFHDLLYLTSNKDNAKEYANGYCFGGDLQESDKPTIYTFDIDIDKLNLFVIGDDNKQWKELVKENSWEEYIDENSWECFGDITCYYDDNINFKQVMFNKYDGVIAEYTWDDVSWYYVIIYKTDNIKPIMVEELEK